MAAYTESLATALSSRDHEVHVLSCAPGQPHDDRNDGGVRIHFRSRVRLPGLGAILRAPQAVERLEAALSCWRQTKRLGLDFDVVEAPDWMAEGLGLVLLGPVPLVAHLHSPLRVFDSPANGDSRWDTWLSDVMERTAVRRARLVTSPSLLLRDTLALARWFRAQEVRVVRNPVDVSAWSCAAPVSATGPVVLLVGRLEQIKAPEVAVEALHLLAREIPGVEAVFLGGSNGERDGRPYGEWVRRYATRLGAPCRFVGTVERHQLDRWYARARLLAVTSWYESFHMGALEAMAAGRPVVCTSQTGIAELLVETAAGTVVRPGDPVALAEAMRPFLTDRQRAAVAGEEAQRLVQEHCSGERIAVERERLYEEVQRC
jgi:glycosyltransferase involved in cell wall biosynthesis